MGDNNKVTVRIFDQDYTISGTVSQQQMTEVAAYVDKRMSDLGRTLTKKIPSVSLAVLTAVNIASDLYETQNLVQEQEAEIANLQSRQESLEKLWENAKLSLKSYKENADSSVSELKELRDLFESKNAELAELKSGLAEMTQKYEAAVQGGALSEEAAEEIENLESQLSEARAEAYAYRQELNALKKGAAADSQPVSEKSSSGTVKSNEEISLALLKEKYKEMENSFFDIQMENINLKNKLVEVKKK